MRMLAALLLGAGLCLAGPAYAQCAEFEQVVPHSPFTPIVYRIAEVMEKIVTKTGNEDLDRSIRFSLLKQVAAAVEAGKPVRFLLPSFPAKSPNSESKVLGKDVDLAERLAMERLSQVMEELQKVCPKGAEFLIASDGRVFTGNWWNTDADIDNYYAQLAALPHHPSIKFTRLDDFFPGETPEGARAKLMAGYAPTLEAIDEAISSNPNITRKYLGLKRFNDEDVPPSSWEGVKPNQRKRLNAERSREDLRRSQAYAALLKERFPDHVRLSIHAESQSPEKIAINLLEGGEGLDGAPWHRVVVTKPDGTYFLMKRSDAEKAGYELKLVDGKPDHFEVPSP